jgi:DNA polymerase-3 subunit epsilon
MSGLILQRPLAVFDIESTGTDVQLDRIIELAIVKLMPDGARQCKTWLVNPGVPIPAETSAIHGIKDADVADKPLFKEIACLIAAELDGCDLGGYNLLRFDIPMLENEFRRANVVFKMEGRKVVDAQRIFHMKEPRDLSAAVVYYCGKRHDNAHGAEADAEATLDVLEGQLIKYPDLPKDIESLDLFCASRPAEWLDRTGRFRWTNGQIVVNFGSKKGQSLKELVDTRSSFLRWILENNFPSDTKELIRKAFEGSYPPPPPPEKAADEV